MSKKNLDQLFQEKFKDFTEVPSEHIWEKIEASLDRKKKNRMVIPFWWKLGGVAALLTVLLYVINPFEATLDETPIVTDIEKSDSNISKEKEIENKDVIKNSVTPENSIVESESNSIDESKNGITLQKNRVVKPEITNTLNKTPKASKSTLDDLHTKVVENDSKSHAQDAVLSTKNSQVENAIRPEKDVVVIREADQIKLDKKGKDANQIIKEKEILQDAIPNTEDLGIAEKEVPNETIINPEKKSIFDEIDAQNEEKLAENSGNKWSVGANVAPVYFNSFGEGSPIHSSFVPNSKSGEINLSYGLSVAYSVNKKMNVRAGINKVEYGYATNDVEFSSTFNASSSDQIPNINYTQTSENLFVSSKTSANALKNGDAFDFASFGNTSRDAVMSQQFGYLEVPVELDYSLIDKRFGVNLVGGLSTLFLIDNSVSIASGDLTTEIGTANNLNSVNFSTNIGLGVNYKFTPKILLNIEPVFKYQLNTFSNTSGNFQPYSLGIYSGLQFKF